MAFFGTLNVRFFFIVADSCKIVIHSRNFFPLSPPPIPQSCEHFYYFDDLEVDFFLLLLRTFFSQILKSIFSMFKQRAILKVIDVRYCEQKLLILIEKKKINNFFLWNSINRFVKHFKVWRHLNNFTDNLNYKF